MCRQLFTAISRVVTRQSSLTSDDRRRKWHEIINAAVSLSCHAACGYHDNTDIFLSRLWHQRTLTPSIANTSFVRRYSRFWWQFLAVKSNRTSSRRLACCGRTFVSAKQQIYFLLLIALIWFLNIAFLICSYFLGKPGRYCVKQPKTYRIDQKVSIVIGYVYTPCYLK